MRGQLTRLVRSLAAYQLADVVSKLIAVLLLPVYTRYIAPSGYGVVELLGNGVIFVSIVVRFGLIESFLRFYFTDEDAERRAALTRRTTLVLLATTTLAAAALAAAAGPLSQLVLSHRDVPTFLVAVLGLWTFTNLELAYGMLRVQERLRAYATASVSNVLLTVAGSVVLVVVLGQGARGLLLGNYAASTIVLATLWWQSRGQMRLGLRVGQPLRELLSFGLPTVPAEASVYALSIVDRYYLYHQRGAGPAGLYSIALKFAGAIALIVRAFQYAWPPLAYSIGSDMEAAAFYGLITTYYVLVCGWIVAALALLGRWVLRLLTARAYLGAHSAIGWVALGWAMYGLWVIFLVIAGRAGATRRNFPASLAGLATNVVLLVLLVPAVGIAGAGVALAGAYLAMLAVMFLLTRDLLRVQFEWRRLLQLVSVMGAVTVAGELLLPTSGVGGLLSRGGAVLAIPLLLALTRFPTRRELDAAKGMLRRARRATWRPRDARGAT